MLSTRLYLLFAFITAVASAFVPRIRQDDVQHATSVRDAAGSQCGFQGNSDLYGLGIRLGIYFQWLSAQLCRVLYKEYVVDLDRVYMIFLAAVFIALLVLTGDAKSTYDVEVLVLMYILICGPFNFISGQLGEYRSIALVNIEFLVVWPATVYSCWFWFVGRDSRFLQQPVDCGTYGFVFKQVSLRSHSTLSFLQAVSVLLAILFGLGHGMWFYVVPWTRWRKDREENKPILESVISWWGPSIMEGREGGETDRDDLTQSVFSKFYSAFCLAFPILGIELSLKWNSVTGVYTIRSIGQLIPFVTGLAGLVQVIYGILRHKIYTTASISSSTSTLEAQTAAIPEPLNPESKQLPSVKNQENREQLGENITLG